MIVSLFHCFIVKQSLQSHKKHIRHWEEAKPDVAISITPDSFYLLDPRVREDDKI